MIRFTQKGGFRKTEKYLKKLGGGNLYLGLERYGQMGVQALSDATPKKTGKTASSWGYSIEKTNKGLSINWTNSNINDGVPVAILIQYGHAMPSGYYVEGIDYINPALKPVFDSIAKNVWEEVTAHA